MKNVLAPVLLLTLLFPSLVIGEMKIGEKITTKDGWSIVRVPDKKEQSLNDWIEQGKQFLCETAGVGCPEPIDMKDLVKRNGVYFKKFTEVPFTGKTTGKEQGLFKDGKRDGPFVSYHSNGQLESKGTYKDGKKEGPWTTYHDNGKLSKKGPYKNGRLHGPWVGFYKDGSIMESMTGNFVNRTEW